MIRKVINVMMGGFGNVQMPTVQQYDEEREYLCRLWRAPGVPFVLADNTKVGVVFQWRGIRGSKEYDTERENNSTVVVTVPKEAMLRDGIVKMQLKIHQDDELLHSPELVFQVLKSIKAMESDGE